MKVRAKWRFERIMKRVRYTERILWKEGPCIYRAHEGEGSVLGDVPIIAGLNRVRTEALQTAI